MPKIGNSIDNGMLYTIQQTNYVAIFNLFTTLTYSNYNPDHLASCGGDANKTSLQLFYVLPCAMKCKSEPYLDYFLTQLSFHSTFNTACIPTRCTCMESLTPKQHMLSITSMLHFYFLRLTTRYGIGLHDVVEDPDHGGLDDLETKQARTKLTL